VIVRDVNPASVNEPIVRVCGPEPRAIVGVPDADRAPMLVENPVDVPDRRVAVPVRLIGPANWRALVVPTVRVLEDTVND
jgi:hypothetical protein